MRFSLSIFTLPVLGAALLASGQGTRGLEASSTTPGFPKDLQAYWIDRTTVLIPAAEKEDGAVFQLVSDPQARIRITAQGVAGGQSLPLICCAMLNDEERGRFPQLAGGYAALKLPADTQESTVKHMLQGQLLLAEQRGNGSVRYATGVQNAGVLDDLFAYDGRLGVVIRGRGARDAGGRDSDDQNSELKVKVWAPTAQSMEVELFVTEAQKTPTATVPMHRRGGVWAVALDSKWEGHFYLLKGRVYAPSVQAVEEVEVTDPYSIDLALNGTKSRLTDAGAQSTRPAGWEADRAPELARWSDLSIYELHVRDFSIRDKTVSARNRGSYLAFTESGTDGMRHLRTLADAGMKAIHLLPTFHFDSVNEDKSSWKETGDLSGYPAGGTQQREAVRAVQDKDGYNWGYDPVHYLAVQGSYAVHPEDRVREYRSMVQALHRTGLRVIQDVVFNHTSGFGQQPSAVLDRVVPNYYNRLDRNGRLMTSTCCANTANERRMMSKLQVDALVWNARTYHIDGFRFDLMGFSFLENLRQIRAALDRLTVTEDGVDGKQIYLYGEGWSMGEMADDSLGKSATQKNLYGSGVGSFNDRLRDGVRGAMDSENPQRQGFATGLAAASNGSESNALLDGKQGELQNEENWIRAGLAGNLRDYPLVDVDGRTKRAGELQYNGSPVGYTASPTESVNYVSAHDDRSLFDMIQLKAPAKESAELRARRQALAMSIVALGQGIPFFMAGDDLLRSKDMDSDSFNSGDWFNGIDWTGRGNNWGIGLPLLHGQDRADAREAALLANARLKPGPETIQRTAEQFQEFLRIRYGSPLFRMAAAAEISEHLHFLNTGADHLPGTLAMELEGAGYGPYRHILVVFNARTEEARVPLPELKGVGLKLHPVLRDSADLVVRGAEFAAGEGVAHVPGLTAAVFVSEE